MAIRKISDLPNLTPEQLSMEDSVAKQNFEDSNIELSYLSARNDSEDDQFFTYVSRKVLMSDFKRMLLNEVFHTSAVFEGTKYFQDGLSATSISANEFCLSGDMRCNEGIDPNNYTANLYFGNITLSSSNPVSIIPSGKVSETDTDDNESIVNYGCLTSYVSNYFNNHLSDDIMDEIRRKIEEIDRMLSGIGIDYDSIWPLGSIYITTDNSGTCPLTRIMPDSIWQKIDGTYLLASGKLAEGEVFNVTGINVEPGLPQHTHSYTKVYGNAGRDHDKTSNGRYSTSSTTGNASNGIYGKSVTVRPKSYVVNVWERVAVAHRVN